MDFISEYKLLQENSINFSEKEDEILSMIKRFNPQKHLDALLASIETIPIDLSKDYNAINNFLDLLKNEAFIQKLEDQDKHKIWLYIIKILSVEKKKLKSYLILRYWLSILLKSYGEYVNTHDVKKIFQIKLLKDCSPVAFIRYFRVHNQPIEYLEAIKAEFNKQEESDIARYNIDKEDVEYVSWDDNLFKSFFEIFLDTNNINASSELLRQWFSKLWRDEEKLEYFRITIDRLTPELLSKFEDMILLILDGYFKNRYGLDSKYWHIEELFTSDNFHYLLWKIVTNNEIFLNSIINNLYSRETYIHWPILDVLVYSLTLQWVELLVNHSLIKDNRRMFFDIYLGVQRSNRPDKNDLIQKFKELRWDRIEQNDKNIEKSREEDTIRKSEKDNEIKSTIWNIIVWIESWEILFSQHLLHLYQEHWQLFTTQQIEVLKSQIQVILSNDTFFDIVNKAEVHYSKEQKNSFTRPDYMSYQTLDKCYMLWKELWIDVIWLYRTKFVHYLPFSYNPKYFDDIEDLNKEEINYLLEVYSPNRDQKDDLRIFHPYRFFEIVEKFKKLFRRSKNRREKTIFNLKELLKLDADRLSVRSKKQIISFFAHYLPIEFFLEEIHEYIGDSNLNKYHYFNDFLSWKISDKQESERYDLRCIVNDILCASFKNDQSIKWRLKQLHTIKISLEMMPSGVTYGVTPLQDEIDSFHRDKRHFIDALETIEHPEYKKQIIQILKHSFTFDQDKNLVAWYLQRFVFSYYNEIKKTEQIEALLDLKKKISSKKNSRNFLEWYFPRLLSKLWYIQLQDYKTKKAEDEIKLLKKKLKELADNNRKTIYNFNELTKKYKEALEGSGDSISSKHYLFVEWVTDVEILNIAYNQLYENYIMPFKIIVVWWCKNYPSFFVSFLNESIGLWEKTFWLLDRDKDWYSVFNKLRNKPIENVCSSCEPSFNKYTIIEPSKIKEIKHIENNCMLVRSIDLNSQTNQTNQYEMKNHIILLPVPERFNSYVFIPQDKWINNAEKTYKLNCMSVQIEHLLHFEWINDVCKNWEWEWFFWENNWILFFKGNKMNFLDWFKNNPSKVPKENFKPLFEYIHKVIWLDI